MGFDKKGEISSSFLVSLIILIVAVGVILYIFYQFNFTKEINDQICKESVILRGSVPSYGEVQNFVPLKCKTEKFCITSKGGGECEDTYAAAKDVEVVEVKKDLEIAEFLTKEIVGCWGMIGEGKIPLYSPTLKSKLSLDFRNMSSSCVICSRIAYDSESLDKINLDIANVDVEGYMASHKMFGTQVSYLDYLVGEDAPVVLDNSIVVTEEQATQFKNDHDINLSEIEGLVSAENQRNSEIAVVFMQVSADTQDHNLRNGVVGLGMLLAGVVTGNPLLIVSGAGGAIISAGHGFKVRQDNNVAFGYCSDMVVGKKAGTACSVVRTVKYDLESLRNVCGNIESIG